MAEVVLMGRAHVIRRHRGTNGHLSHPFQPTSKSATQVPHARERREKAPRCDLRHTGRFGSLAKPYDALVRGAAGAQRVCWELNELPGRP
jgi:hypothetical protein